MLQALLSLQLLCQHVAVAASELCSESAFSRDSRCAAGVDGSLSLFNSTACAAAACLQSECCAPPQLCSGSAFTSDAECATGLDAALQVFHQPRCGRGLPRPCGEAACFQSECCISATPQAEDAEQSIEPHANTSAALDVPQNSSAADPASPPPAPRKSGGIMMASSSALLGLVTVNVISCLC